MPAISHVSVVPGPKNTWLERLAAFRMRSHFARRVLELAITGGLLITFATTVWLLRDQTNSGTSAFAARDDRAAAALASKLSGNAADIPAPDQTPTVEPVNYISVPPAIAARVNDMIPFSTAPNVAATPFLFSGTAQEREHALTCLALAAFYEAGDDPAGQSAVIQVILNRVRHPAFPKNICGVVLQGAERSTGCQFTFACDGSMARRTPSSNALARARSSASRALNGVVFTVVGEATHYHTNWVLPRWSGQMDKLTAFHGHLFFRWRGAWGRPSAYRGAYAGPEPISGHFLRFAAPVAGADPAMAGAIDLIPASTIDPVRTPHTVNVAGIGTVPATGGIVREDAGRHIYYVHFAGSDYPGSYAITAWKICAGKSPCTVFGWRSQTDIPTIVTDTPPNMMGFAFYKNENAQKSLWNCRETTRDNKAQCLPGTATIAQSSPNPVVGAQ